MAKKTEEGTVSKMEAVRQTLAQGIDKPQEGIDHIKQNFGIDLPAGIFSSYKSMINSKKGVAPGKRGRKPKSMSATGSGSKAHGGDVLQLAQEVKALVGKYGADAVKGMADVFAS
jgi:hypothetical protein